MSKYYVSRLIIMNFVVFHDSVDSLSQFKNTYGASFGHRRISIS